MNFVIPAGYIHLFLTQVIQALKFLICSINWTRVISTAYQFRTLHEFQSPDSESYMPTRNYVVLASGYICFSPFFFFSFTSHFFWYVVLYNVTSSACIVDQCCQTLLPSVKKKKKEKEEKVWCGRSLKCFRWEYYCTMKLDIIYNQSRVFICICWLYIHTF